MLGETTLAMLYVPLLFYLFDRFAEGDDEKAGKARPAPAAAAAAVAAPGSGGSGPGPHASREDV
jgi:hypothetical protein